MEEAGARSVGLWAVEAGGAGGALRRPRGRHSDCGFAVSLGDLCSMQPVRLYVASLAGMGQTYHPASAPSNIAVKINIKNEPVSMSLGRSSVSSLVTWMEFRSGVGW